MPALDVDKVLARSKVGFDELEQNRSIIEDVYEYMIPQRNTFRNTNTKTHNKPTVQYDSTAMQAVGNFVNTMQSNFTPVFTRWAELKAGPAVPEKERPELNEALEEITDKIFTYLNASNFSTAFAEMTVDWGIGTGAMWLHEGDETQPLNFITTPMSEMALVEGRFGTVDGRFRRYKIKARLIEQTWPNDKVELNANLQNLIKEKGDEEVEFIEACYYDYTDLAWYYDVIYEADKHRLLSKPFTEEVCFTPRWMKIPNHALGIGPFVLAMADTKTLAKMKEYMLKNAAMSTFGVYTVASSGGFNPNMAKIAPSTFIPVERNAGPNGPTIQPLPRAGDFSVQEFMIRDLQDSIRKTMLDTRLPEQQATPATAFEIAQRIQEFQQDIGSAYGRAMFEFVQPLFKRIIAILGRKGLLPQLPEGFEIDNLFVQVQVVSPIARTQALEDVQTFLQTYQMVANLSPELAQLHFKIEDAPQYITEKMGSTSKLLRTEDEVTELVKQAGKLASQQQEGGNDGNNQRDSQ